MVEINFITEDDLILDYIFLLHGADKTDCFVTIKVDNIVHCSTSKAINLSHVIDIDAVLASLLQFATAVNIIRDFSMHNTESCSVIRTFIEYIKTLLSKLNKELLILEEKHLTIRPYTLIKLHKYISEWSCEYIFFSEVISILVQSKILSDVYLLNILYKNVSNMEIIPTYSYNSIKKLWYLCLQEFMKPICSSCQQLKILRTNLLDKFSFMLKASTHEPSYWNCEADSLGTNDIPCFLIPVERYLFKLYKCISMLRTIKDKFMITSSDFCKVSVKSSAFFVRPVIIKTETSYIKSVRMKSICAKYERVFQPLFDELTVVESKKKSTITEHEIETVSGDIDFAQSTIIELSGSLERDLVNIILYGYKDYNMPCLSKQIAEVMTVFLFSGFEKSDAFCMTASKCISKGLQSNVDLYLSQNLTTAFHPNEAIIENFFFSFSNTNFVTCKYTAMWPSTLVLNESAIEKYSEIFNFLFILKRTKWSIERLAFDDIKMIPQNLSHKFVVFRTRVLGFLVSLINVIFNEVHCVRMRFLNKWNLPIAIYGSSLIGFDVTKRHEDVKIDDLLRDHESMLNDLGSICFCTNHTESLNTVVNKLLDHISDFSVLWLNCEKFNEESLAKEYASFIERVVNTLSTLSFILKTSIDLELNHKCSLLFMYIMDFIDLLNLD